MDRRRLFRSKFRKQFVDRSLALAFVVLMALTMSTQWATTQDEGAILELQRWPANLPAARDPHLGPTVGCFDAQYPYQTHAYDLAAKIPAVLHQQAPCYCYCDRMGHNSLHSCLRGYPWRAMLYLLEGALLLLSAAPEGQDSLPKSAPALSEANGSR